MNWSLRIGKLFGIDLKVHLTFFLILVWGAFSYGGSAGPLYGIVVVLALFTLVVLHELGHSLAAMWFGAIFLLPIVTTLSAVQSVPFSMGLLTEPGLLGLLTFLLIANVTLVAFNMIPAFPLDGGRVFRASLGLFTDHHKATKIAVNVGRVFALGLGVYGIVNGQIFLALIAFFIFVAGGQEGQAVAARTLLKTVQAREALNKNNVALSPEATVGQVASMMISHPQPTFAVLDPDSGQFLGVATSGSVSLAMQKGQWHTRITEIMHHAKNIPTIALNATLDEVQDKLVGASTQVVAVYDGLHFRGVISANDVYRVFRFLSQSGRTAQRAAF
jgi:stage IV sporulation protein FB